jgi:hypothetical protein
MLGLVALRSIGVHLRRNSQHESFLRQNKNPVADYLEGLCKV